MSLKKLKKSAAVAGIILSVAMLMSGCASTKYATAPTSVNGGALYGTENKVAYEYEYEPAYEEAYYDDYAGMGDGNAVAGVQSAQGVQGYDGGNIVDSGSASVGNNQNRKLIRTVDLEVETKTYDELKAGIEEQVKLLGGYIEQEYSYNGSTYNGSKQRFSNMTIRIPDNKLDEFVTVMSGMSNVVSKNTTATDVTLQYTDIESKRDMYRAELESLTALLEKAESIEDITYLTQRMTEVRYSIESMERQLRVYDNQVDYATVDMRITEVEVLTPPVVVQKTPGEEIKEGFKASLLDVLTSLRNFGMNFVINLPYIIRVLVILGIIFGVIRLTIHIIVKSVKKKRAKKLAKKEAEAAKNADAEKKAETTEEAEKKADTTAKE